MTKDERRLLDAISRLPFVQVVWWDAEEHPGGWADIEDAQQYANEACKVISYGYLLAANKSYVVLAADQIMPNVEALTSLTFGRITKIPRPVIRSIKRIKP